MSLFSLLLEMRGIEFFRLCLYGYTIYEGRAIMQPPHSTYHILLFTFDEERMVVIVIIFFLRDFFSMQHRKPILWHIMFFNEANLEVNTFLVCRGFKINELTI